MDIFTFKVNKFSINEVLYDYNILRFKYKQLKYYYSSKKFH